MTMYHINNIFLICPEFNCYYFEYSFVLVVNLNIKERDWLVITKPFVILLPHESPMVIPFLCSGLL